MKKHITITLLILFAVSFWNCEKDDICADGTPVTPRLIVSLFDTNNPNTAKVVGDLIIKANDVDEDIKFVGQSKLEIPLKTTADQSIFEFKLNSTDTDISNDIVFTVTVNYIRNDVYISRACGFKTLFYLNESNGFEWATNTWIQNVEIVEPNIETENETHVKIFI